MSLRILESGSAHLVDAGQELIDSIVAAVDSSRTEEVDQVRRALELFGLDEAFDSELRLSGVGSECVGECWYADNFDHLIELAA